VIECSWCDELVKHEDATKLWTGEVLCMECMDGVKA